MQEKLCCGNLIRVLILLFAWSGFGRTQAGELPRVINYAKTDYQAQSQNWSIAQSPEGFLYFANSAGLLEFDGAHWTLYPLPDRQIVRAVACDPEGRVFTGGFGEFGYWQRQPSGRLTYRSLSRTLHSEKASQEEIWQIHLLPHSVLFQSFSTFYEYDYRAVKPVSTPGNIMFLQPVNGRVLTPVIDQGLFEWMGDEKFQFIPGSEELAANRISSILPLPDGLLVGTEQAGLFFYNGRRFETWPTDIDPQLKAYQLNRACRLPDGQLALGTILNGLYILDRNGRLRYHFNKENGLQNNTVLALYHDAAGDLWVGLDKGIDQVTLSDPLLYLSDKAGQTGTTYSAALFHDQLYLGTNQGLFVRPWKSKGAEPFRLLKGTQGQVWEVSVIDGQLLVGHNDGTFRVDEHGIERISPVNGGWCMQRIPGHPDKLLQGTYTGLVLFEKDAAGQWQFRRRIDSFIQPLKAIVFDKTGRLWGVHPYRGLFRFRLSSGLDSLLELRTFSGRDGLPSEFRLHLERVDDRIVVGADNRLFFWNENADHFQPVASPSITPEIILDGLDNEWFQILPDQVVWMRDTQQVGLFPLSLVADYEHIIPLNEATYLFCLDNGYALLKRWVPQPALPPPAPLIRQVLCRSNGAVPEFLPVAPPSSTMRLSAARNNLHFTFALPYFGRGIRFRYRLRGFQNEWSEWSTLSTREFTNLAPGTYTFDVQTDVSDNMASFAFSILPPWHQTVWARLLYLAMGAGLAWWFWRLHHWRLARQRRRLEIERDRQLQQQRIRTRNEQLQNDIINKSKELANSTFNLIRKNELLLQMKEELNALQNNAGSRLPDKHHRHLVEVIDRHLSNEQDWEVFETNFNQVHDVFFQRLIRDFPDLTPGDLRLAAYLKMNLSSKEIAPLLNISVRGVENKRYRLRRKLNLPADENLTEFMINFEG